MLTYPRIFSEVVIWGLALFCFCILISVHIIYYRKYLLIYVLSFCCGAALFTRPTYTVAVIILFVLTVSLVFLKDKSLIKFQRIHILIGSVLFFSFLALLAIYNQAKWGDPLEFFPLQYYKMFIGTSFLDEFYQSGGSNQLSRIPAAFAFYFFPTVENLSSHFPFLQLGYPQFFVGLSARIYDEPTVPLTLSLPLYMILAVLGGIYLLSNFRSLKQSPLLLAIIPSLISAIVLIPPILTLHAKATRYQGEFIPLILLLSSFYMSRIVQKWNTFELKHTSAFFLKNRSTYMVIWIFGILMIFLSTFLEINTVLLQNTLINQASIEKYVDSDKKYYFSNNQQNANSALSFIKSGVDVPENWGSWSNSSELILIFPPLQIGDPGGLRIEARALVDSIFPKQLVEIWINGKYSKTVELSYFDKNVIDIPLNNKNDGVRQKNILERYVFKRPVHAQKLEIKLLLPNAHKPIKSNANSSSDARNLAIGLISVQFYER